MLTLAVALHNIPEGMAVGAVYAGWLYGDSGITLAGALALSLGIAIQNFPEGAIISMPLKAEGVSKSRSFLYGTLSGAVEPIGAILTILLAGILVPVLPYALSFAAGAIDPGDVSGKALQYRDYSVCSRFYPHDDAGCGAGCLSE